jgi:hypothetical protein
VNLVVDSTGYINLGGFDPNDFYPQNEWTHIAFTFSSSSNEPMAYKNGVSQTLTTANNPESITATADRKYLAAQPAATTNISAGFDEVRVSGTVRSPEWIQTEYNNQNDPSSFFSIGTEDGSCTLPAFPSFVQAAPSYQSAASKAAILTFSSAVAKGNLIVTSVTWDSQTIPIKSVSDSSGNTYLPAVGKTLWNGATSNASTWYAYNANAGTPTITIALDTNDKVPIEAYAAEYTGITNTTDPLDRTSAQTGTGWLLNSGSGPTTQARELIYGFGASATTATPAYPYTARKTDYGNFIADQSVGSTGNYYVAGTNSPSGNWVCQMATFRGK